MNKSSFKRVVVFLVALSLALSIVLSSQFSTGQPAPVETAPADVTPEAQAVLDMLGKTYTDLKTLELSGSINAEFDVAGRQQKQQAEFTSTFQSASHQFRHEMKDDIIIGSTGEKAYAYHPTENMYLQNDLEFATDERFDSKALPPMISRLLAMQNPSLLLALSKEPSLQLIDGATEVKKLADETIDDAAFTALSIKSPDGDSRVLIDPKTSLIRRVVVDLSPMLRNSGENEVAKAEVVFDYTASTSGRELDAAQFAWTPPENARDATRTAAAENDDADSLVGKPAPDFTLASLDGAEVKLADLRGNVVVLDFWATWCGPCVVSMPLLMEVHKEVSPRGVKLFAINIAEDKEKVSGFLNSRKIELPVLLDSDSRVAEAYGVRGIPMSVVIDGKGIVKNVNVGFGPGGEDKLRKQIDAAAE